MGRILKKEIRQSDNGNGDYHKNRRYFTPDSIQKMVIALIIGVSGGSGVTLLSGSDKDNIRLNKQGILRLSKPCYHCYMFLKIVGAKCVWFSTDVGFARMNLN